jgi:hypothetical protein
MCTITYLPVGDKLFLTSNRDEQTLRQPAAQPTAQQFDHGRILFPRDGKAGGTWIGLHNNGNAMVLMNGGFERHIPAPPYRKSRGLVFLEIFDAANPVTQFDSSDLEGIEPFSLVLHMPGSLWEMRWNGKEKYISPKPVDRPQIWSSATLYDKEVIEKREHWFNDWLQQTDSFTAETITQFHRLGGEGNERIDLMMNRDGLLRTVSITCMELCTEKSVMYYNDMVNGQRSVNEWLFAG